MYFCTASAFHGTECERIMTSSTEKPAKQPLVTQNAMALDAEKQPYRASRAQ